MTTKIKATCTKIHINTIKLLIFFIKKDFVRDEKLKRDEIKVVHKIR